MPPRKPKSKAPPHPDEARKAELEVKMRSGGLVSSELEELQRIRKRIDDAAAEEEARKQAMRDQFRNDILREEQEAAERLVRLEREAKEREVEAQSIKLDFLAREAKLNSRPESRPPRRTQIGMGPGLTASYSHDHLYVKGPPTQHVRLTKPPWMIRQEKEWAAEALERESMFEEEQRCIKAWEAAAVLASGMVDILNEVVDVLMWKHLAFLEWERDRIRAELGEMALADAESELAMEAYRLSEQFAADQRQKARLGNYRRWCKEKWKWIPLSDYHNPKRRDPDWDCSNCNQLNKRLLFVCAFCGTKRLDDEIQYEKDLRTGKWGDESESDGADSDASSSSDEEAKLAKKRLDMFSPGRVEHTAAGTRGGGEDQAIVPKARATPAERSKERRLRLRRERAKRINPVAFAREEGLKGIQSQKAIQSAVDEGNPTPIIKEMRRNRDNTNVQAAGCSGLGLLAVTGPLERVIEEGGVKSIVRAMEAHEDSVLLQRAACKSLYTLAAGVEAKSKNLSGRGGGSEADKERLSSLVHQINDLGGAHSVAMAANAFPSDRVLGWATDKLTALMQRQRDVESAARQRVYVAKCRDAADQISKCLDAWPEDLCQGVKLFQGFDALSSTGKEAVKELPKGDVLRSGVDTAVKRASADTLEGGTATMRKAFRRFLDSFAALENDEKMGSSIGLDNLEHQRAFADMRERQRRRRDDSSHNDRLGGGGGLFSPGGGSRALNPMRHQPDMLEGFLPLEFQSPLVRNASMGPRDFREALGSGGGGGGGSRSSFRDGNKSTRERAEKLGSLSMPGRLTSRDDSSQRSAKNLLSLGGSGDDDPSGSRTLDLVRGISRGEFPPSSAGGAALSDYGWDTTPPGSRDSMLSTREGRGSRGGGGGNPSRNGSSRRYEHRVNPGSRGGSKRSNEVVSRPQWRDEQQSPMEQTQFNSCMNVAKDYFDSLDRKVNALRSMLPPEPEPVRPPKEEPFRLSAAELARLKREWRVGRHAVVPDWLQAPVKRLDFESFFKGLEEEEGQ